MLVAKTHRDGDVGHSARGTLSSRRVAVKEATNMKDFHAAKTKTPLFHNCNMYHFSSRNKKSQVGEINSANERVCEAAFVVLLLQLNTLLKTLFAQEIEKLFAEFAFVKGAKTV